MTLSVMSSRAEEMIMGILDISRILGMLVQHKYGSVSREQLLYESEHIDDDSSIKNIDVIISRVRQKIAKIDPNNIYIKPIRGVGYLLTDRV